MIEYIFVAIAIAGMIGSLRQLHRDVITIHQFIFWIIVWLGIIVGIFFIDWVGQFTPYFGISRTLDLIITVSLIILFWTMFKITVKQENISRQITEIIRKDAIQNAKKKK